MEYNWAKKKMKKTTFIVASMLAFLSFNAFKTADAVGTTSTKSVYVDSRYYVEATLINDYYNQQLYLYSDGTCVIRTEEGRGTGTYDISGLKIYYNWNNGTKQQGSISKENGVLKSVSVEGITYSKKRDVKPRR